MLLAKPVIKIIQVSDPIGTASASSLESDLGCTSRVYFDNMKLTSYTITSSIAAKQMVTTFHKML